MGRPDIVRHLRSLMRQHGERLAAIDKHQSITYHDLDQLSEELALRLLATHSQPGDRVVLAIDRSIYALVGMVAVLKAGLTYIPQEWDGLDEHVFDRIPDSRQYLFITRAAFSPAIQRLRQRVIVIDAPTPTSTGPGLLPVNADDDLLYTVFTSGSTGAAKGVDISCSNVMHYQRALAQLLNITTPLRYAYVSSLSADLGNTSVFLSLFSGGTLHLIDDDTRRDATRFQNYLAEHRIDVLKITPSHFISLCEGCYACWQLQWIIFGGEPLPAELAKSVLLRGQALHVANHYGPSETTIGVACYPMRSLEEVPASGSVPVGSPLGDTELVLINAQGEILPPGQDVEGELLIGGPGVARGYFNDAALTRQKFVTHPDVKSGRRFFASGDIFLRTATGQYFFTGRKDRQVKISGYRVDPEAVEAAISQHADVSAVAVLAQPTSAGPHCQLIAAIVVNTSATGVQSEIRQHLRRVLPKHMVPARMLLLESIPLTGNGKVDLNALKAAIGACAGQTPDQVDLTAIDADPHLVALAQQAWTRYTGVAPTSPDQDFYAAGGDSILAIQLLSALQSQHLSLNPATFYATPTFRGLIASLCTQQNKTEQETAAMSERYLSPIQHWFFAMYPEGPNHWVQTVLIDSGRPIDAAAMQTSVNQLRQAYPILSTAFIRSADGWHARDGAGTLPDTFHVHHLPPHASVANIIEDATRKLQLTTGHLFQVLLLRQQDKPDRLAVICHHLVIDGVSWRILLDDLARLYLSARQGAPRTLEPDAHRYWSWTRQLKKWAETLPPTIETEARPDEAAGNLPTDFNTGPNNEKSCAVGWLSYDEPSTHVLLHDLPHHFGLPIQNILLASLLRGIAKTFGYRKSGMLVDIETHGRHLFTQDLDLNRAVGWFTALSPWKLDVFAGESLQVTAARIQQDLDGLLQKGVEHGARHYLTETPAQSSPVPALCFNYLGHFMLDQDPELAWSWSGDYPGAARHPSADRLYQLKFTGRIVDGQLAIDLSYSTHRHARNTIERLLDAIGDDLSEALADVAPLLAGHPPRRCFTHESSTGLLTYMPARLRQHPRVLTVRKPQVVLLTGATGFIGIYLLRELLAQQDLEIHCLVRSKGEQSAERRLWEQFHRYFPQDARQDLRHRVVIHQGDITAEQLNLADPVYTALATRVDTVFHAAADVRLLAPLEDLRLVNVQGTRNLITFCRLGGGKKLHYVSTLSVAGVNPKPEDSAFTEDDLHYGQSFLSPYEHSKYEAEVAVRQFIAAGGKACIHRTGSVSADGAGNFQVNIDSNRVMQSICTYVLSGVVPSRAEDLLLCPVDSLVRAMVSLAMHTQTPTTTFHLTPPRQFMHDELVPILNNLGFRVRLDTEEAYLHALASLETSHPREVTLGRLWSARVSRGVRIEASRTHHYLQHLGTAIPPVDETWFARFLQRCVVSGYLVNEEMMHSQRS